VLLWRKGHGEKMAARCDLAYFVGCRTLSVFVFGLTEEISLVSGVASYSKIAGRCFGVRNTLPLIDRLVSDVEHKKLFERLREMKMGQLTR